MSSVLLLVDGDDGVDSDSGGSFDAAAADDAEDSYYFSRNERFIIRSR